MADNILTNIWPEWQIVKQIGRGSFGVVYEAVRTDHFIESYSAIKVISIPQNESEIDSLRTEGLSENASRTYLQGVVDEFVDEIRLMESFKGTQNIVSVEDYKVVERTDEIGWDIYIRMELLTPFNSYIRDKALSEKEVIKLGVDICTALELCAKCNVIHRDIKPENIFMNQFGDFKLGDFGIARKLENVTGGLSRKGTYYYMAPEVECGNQYGATVDLYSLGLVLYRFLNRNRLPFLETERQLLNPNERMAAVRRRMDGEQLPAPCDASPAMAELILCACSPDPSRRFASASEMKNALIRAANSTYSGNEDVRLVRHTSQAVDLDKTTSVRKAPQAHNTAQNTIGTFGGKKKSKAPIIVAAVLAATLFVGGIVYAIPRLLDGNVGGKNTETDDVAPSDAVGGESENLPDGKNRVYSDYDEEQIAAAIEEADTLAAAENYEGALAKINAALAVYPKSEALLAKEEELTQILETNSAVHSYSYVVDACSWSEAFEKAKAAGGYLARIETMEEYIQILSEIEAEGLTHIEFRIGARRAYDGADYYWVDENNVMFGDRINDAGYWAYSEWLPGEPSYQWGTNSEEFVEIYFDQKTEKWVWNDVSDNVYKMGAEDRYGYIVEFDS